MACEMYADDFNDYYPYNTTGDPDRGFGWRASPRLLMPDEYTSFEFFNCPSIPSTVPPMGDFPIDEYYGDAFDETAQVSGWNPGKSVRASYEFNMTAHPDYEARRRSDKSYKRHLIHDLAGGIRYYDAGYHERFLPMVSHGGEGGNVAHIDTSVIWLGASEWQWPGTSPYDAWSY